MLVAAFIGLWWGELVALRRCDIDLAGRVLHVRRRLAPLRSTFTTSDTRVTRHGRRIAACVASTVGRTARMADKELLDRIAAAVEDAEATPDEELEWTRHREPAKSPTAV
jgi:hypothetical protein